MHAATRRLILSLILGLLLGAGAYTLGSLALRPAQPTPVTLRVLASQEDPAMHQIIRAFTHRYPHYTVHLASLPSGPNQVVDLVDAMVGGSLDVVPTNTLLQPEGLLLSLDRPLRRTGFDLTPLAGVEQAFRSRGQLYGLPYEGRFHYLTYDPKLFTEAGLPPPDDSGWTWEEFRTAIAQLTTGEDFWGLDAAAMEFFVRPWMIQQGALYPNADESGALRALLELLTAIVLEDGSAPPVQPRDWLEAEVPLQPNRFDSGQAAVTLLRPPTGEQRLVTVPIPTEHRGKLPVLPAGYSIPSDSPHQAAALEFLTFLAGEEAALIRLQYGRLPAYRTERVLEAAAAQSAPINLATLLALEWAPRPVAFGDIGAEARIRRAMQAVNQVLTGSLSIDEAVADYEMGTASLRP